MLPKVGASRGAKDSTGPNKTLGGSLGGSQERDPMIWWAIISRNERMSHVLSPPNTAPANLLTSPKATKANTF